MSDEYVVINGDQAFNRRHISYVRRWKDERDRMGGKWVIKIVGYEPGGDDYRFKTKKEWDDVWSRIVGERG